MNDLASYGRVGLLVLAVLGCACEDASDGTSLELDEFVLDECKGRGSGKLLTGRETSDYAGLECVAWEFKSGDVVIDLINRPAHCGFSGDSEEETLWSPTVKQLSVRQIEYDVQWNFSDPNACGGCLHDFSVRLSDVELDERVRLDVATRSCTRVCTWQRDSVRAAEPSGIRCRYVYNDRDEGGTLRLPPYNGVCEGELVPTELSEDIGSLCLPSCDSDDDCQLGELESCQDGVCKLRDPW